MVIHTKLFRLLLVLQYLVKRSHRRHSELSLSQWLEMPRNKIIRSIFTTHLESHYLHTLKSKKFWVKVPSIDRLTGRWCCPIWRHAARVIALTPSEVCCGRRCGADDDGNDPSQLSREWNYTTTTFYRYRCAAPVEPSRCRWTQTGVNNLVQYNAFGVNLQSV